jgi:hypothetical protein
VDFRATRKIWQSRISAEETGLMLQIALHQELPQSQINAESVGILSPKPIPDSIIYSSSCARSNRQVVIDFTVSLGSVARREDLLFEESPRPNVALSVGFIAVFHGTNQYKS